MTFNFLLNSDTEVIVLFPIKKMSNHILTLGGVTLVHSNTLRKCYSSAVGLL